MGGDEVAGASWRNYRKDDAISHIASGRETHPVVSISWGGMPRPIVRRVGKRLPTDLAEWEICKARSGGTEAKFGHGTSVAEQLPEYAVYSQLWKSHGICWLGKSPNGLGLYDMSGNVWEWVADWYDKDYYQNSPQKNPQGPSSGKKKVLRGGSWLHPSATLRSAYRGRLDPSIRHAFFGVRCAQDAP